MVYALAEAFSVLTGGRFRLRLRAAEAVDLLEQSILAHVRVQTLTAKDVSAALRDCGERGIRGGGVTLITVDERRRGWRHALAQHDTRT